MIFDSFGAVEFCWIALSVFLLGMSKGGFPVGGIALPVMILVWPDQVRAAKSAVAFMLPLLCAMDVVAMLFYRRQILWDRLVRLFPATVAGVAVASFLFLSGEVALVGISDRALKLAIGVIGLLFAAYSSMRSWFTAHLATPGKPGWTKCSLFGFVAGMTSTLAHAAGPVLQIFLLPQKLPKLNFAGTTCAFFFTLNLIKLAPFAALGHIQPPNLLLGAMLLPVIPFGVAAGYGAVRIVKDHHYRWFIHAILAFTSILLIAKSLRP